LVSKIRNLFDRYASWEAGQIGGQTLQILQKLDVGFQDRRLAETQVSDRVFWFQSIRKEEFHRLIQLFCFSQPIYGLANAPFASTIASQYRTLESASRQLDSHMNGTTKDLPPVDNSENPLLQLVYRQNMVIAIRSMSQHLSEAVERAEGSSVAFAKTSYLLRSYLALKRDGGKLLSKNPETAAFGLLSSLREQLSQSIADSPIDIGEMWMLHDLWISSMMMLDTPTAPAEAFQVLLKTWNQQKNQSDRHSGIVAGSLVWIEPWRLETGRMMNSLWKLFRPASPSSKAQFTRLSKVKAFMRRVDGFLWTSSAPLDDTIRLRKILQSLAADSLLNDSISDDISEEIETALSKAEKEAERRVPLYNPKPFFSAEFEVLCQAVFPGTTQTADSIPDELQDSCTLLAQRSTESSFLKSTSPGWKALTDVSQYEASLSNQGLQSLVGPLLRRATEIDTVPIGKLALLDTELHTISRLIASNTTVLKRGRIELLQAAIVDLKTFVQLGLEAEVPDRNQSSNKFILGSDAGLLGLSELDLAIELCLLAVELLRAYIPSSKSLAITSYDPAQVISLTRSLWIGREERLQSLVGSLEAFQKGLTGASPSLEADYLKSLVQKIVSAKDQEIKILGEMPHRSSKVKATSLGLIFSSILSYIPTEKDLSDLFSADEASLDQLENLQRNIAEMIMRLDAEPEELQDVAQPVKGFLSIFNIGIILVSQKIKQDTNNRNSLFDLVWNKTPLLGYNPSLGHLEEEARDSLADYKQYSADMVLHELRRISFLKSIIASPDTQEAILNRATMLFSLALARWKEKLRLDQENEQDNTGLYHFKAKDTIDESTLVLEMFPTFDEDDEQIPVHQRDQNIKIGFQAPDLALVHANIFNNKSGTSLKNLLDDSVPALTKISAASQGLDQTALGLKPLPLVFSVLNKSIVNISSTVSDGSANFYSGQNLKEVRTLLKLLRQVQTRFIELQDAWPEHATLEDVLLTCDEILAFSHIEPLAKYITKVEKLHGFVNQWQVVASKEYSAANLYDNITDLVISWRRIELGTWSQLFDAEEARCRREASNWWFIAYDAAVQTPLELASNNELDVPKSIGVLETLQRFISSTNLGQFDSRLQILQFFKSHLEILSDNYSQLRQFVLGLRNLLSYLNGFALPIKEAIENGKKPLEKQMKEVILLASWKDTNITALRDSAKRSHNKLYRVIRKYRELLNQSTETIVQGGLPTTSWATTKVSTLSQSDEPKLDPAQLDRSKQASDAIAKEIGSQPKRFQNLSATLHTMKQRGRMSKPEFDTEFAIDEFINNLTQSMDSLAKATPTKWIKANATAIKRLKVQKRKLFTDTLKSLRTMGLKAHMSMDILEQQRTLAAIFGISGSFRRENLATIDKLDYYFYKAVDLLPQVRLIANDHHDDLSGSDVVRCVSMIESIVELSIKQRAVLAQGFNESQNLEELLAGLKAVAHSDVSSTTIPAKVSQCNTLELVNWILSILGICIDTAKIQQQFSALSVDSLLTTLEKAQKEFEHLRKEILILPGLPSGLQSDADLVMSKKCYKQLVGLDEQLQGIEDSHPHLQYLTSQIRPYCQIDEQQDVSSLDLKHVKELLDRTQKVNDTILVAIQKLSERSELYPLSNEDPSWLLSSSSADIAILNSFGQDQILKKVQNIVNLTKTPIRITPIIQAIYLQLAYIFEEYTVCSRRILSRLCELNTSTCKLGYTLSKCFINVATKGYCSPKDTPKEEDSQASEKLEEGTGLGDGEGAEDISKDIEGDEDLDELAQQTEKPGEKKDMENEDDAVDIQDEMEGGTEEAQKEAQDESGESGSEDDENDVEEEVGDVDELDENAVDEKMWDGEQKEDEKELQGQDQKGQNVKDEQQAADNGKDDDNGSDEEGSEDNNEQSGALDETEPAVKDEKIEENTNDGQNLDLPDEMDLGLDDTAEKDGDEDDEMLDELSDVENQDEKEGSQHSGDEKDALDGAEGEQEEDDANHEDLDDPKKETEDAVDAEVPQDEPLKEDELKPRVDESKADEENAALSEAQGSGQQQPDETDENKASAQQDQGNEGKGENGTAEMEESVEDNGQGSRSRNQNTEEAGQPEKEENQTIRKLGDALERWQRQTRKIQESTKDESEPAPPKEANPNEPPTQFEHLPDEDADHDAQALDTVSKEQAKGLDDAFGVDTEMKDPEQGFEEDQKQEEQDDAMDIEPEKHGDNTEEDGSTRIGAMIGESKIRPEMPEQLQSAIMEQEEVAEVDSHFSSIHLSPSEQLVRSHEEASTLWHRSESQTRALSLSLTEQLRLILEPTLSSKMRGDFRTGKRLNMKRIIPYIASDYKRDKIWMRRSLPQKRSYQILLAVDDSKSMNDPHSSALAFETLALVSKSLSMLEVGQIGIVGFGEHVNVAHDFATPFTNDAGINVFRQFAFNQVRTDVKKLVEASISLFADAKFRNGSSSGGSAENWQLLMIISDGVCEDHATIQRLCRRANDEKIMIVFIVVDAPAANAQSQQHGPASGAAGSQSNSILDMAEARFEKDPLDENAPMKVRMVRYLDSFPFAFYLVVRDVRELPAVLSTALRGWFAEVVGERG
jgi:midasin